MIPLKSILVTTDFSDHANNAVRRAALLAAQHTARMTLLHVVDPSALKGPRAWFSSMTGLDHKVAVAQATLGRLAAEVAGRHDLIATQAVLVGRPLEQVCRLAEEADLLVIGSKRPDPLRSLLLGTPTEQLLRLVRRPMLVVKQSALDRYERVLVAVDIDRDSESMLHGMGGLANGASLHVFHALSTRRTERMRASDVPADVIREVWDGERQRGIVRLRSTLASIGLTGAQASVEHGDPRLLILERQRAIAADLIVLGQDGQSALCSFLLGGVPRHVLPRAPCDVLVMPKVGRRDRVRMLAGRPWLESAPLKVVEAIAPTEETADATAGRQRDARARIV